MGEEGRGELSEIMRALITGITGFVGSHLAEYLLSEGVVVYGRYNLSDDISTLNKIWNEITIDREGIIKGTKKSRMIPPPDYIFVLDEQQKNSAFNIEVHETIRLFDRILQLNLHPTIILAGCGEEYGCPPLVDLQESDEHESEINRTIRVNYTPKKVFKLPVTEDFSLNPMSIYGVAKAAQDMLGYAYHKEHGMKIVRTRAFDTTGPRDESSVASDIARQMVEVERGKISEITVGSCEIKKDFIDVRDVVKAYWLAAARGKPGEAYNICSGKSRSIQNVIDTLRMQSTAEFELVEDKKLMKVTDIPVMEGDRTKFTKLTGWKPGIGFAQTMGDLLDHWRERA
jgi:GDP-4-dehydro-6-deoxy-D-mannose reductase